MSRNKQNIFSSSPKKFFKTNARSSYPRSQGSSNYSNEVSSTTGNSLDSRHSPAASSREAPSPQTASPHLVLSVSQIQTSGGLLILNQQQQELHHQQQQMQHHLGMTQHHPIASEQPLLASTAVDHANGISSAVRSLNSLSDFADANGSGNSTGNGFDFSANDSLLTENAAKIKESSANQQQQPLMSLKRLA